MIKNLLFKLGWAKSPLTKNGQIKFLQNKVGSMRDELRALRIAQRENITTSADTAEAKPSRKRRSRKATK